MSWLAHLTGNVAPPAWRGPSSLHLKLSAGDVADECEDEGTPATYRACSKCRSLLPLTKHYFFVARREKSGFMSECKCCHKKHGRPLSAQELEQLGGAR